MEVLAFHQAFGNYIYLVLTGEIRPTIRGAFLYSHIDRRILPQWYRSVYYPIYT